MKTLVHISDLESLLLHAQAWGMEIVSVDYQGGMNFVVVTSGKVPEHEVKNLRLVEVKE